MSLVDYDASSSSDKDEDDVGDDEREEEEEKAQDEKEEKRTRAETSGARPPPPPKSASSSIPALHERNRIASANQQYMVPASALPSIEKLPDASSLLSSPSFASHQITGSDHFSGVAAAMAESESRKREMNGSAYPHRKIPRTTLPHPRNVPDTAGGLLVPPQLRGRSNVVTEDVHKLFVSRKHHEASS